MHANHDRREDSELLALAIEDPDAFAVFYRRHVDHVLSFFRRRVHRADVALDLTAETFAAALEASPRYRTTSAPAQAWLFGIARHKLAHAIRRGKSDERVRRRLQMEPIIVDDADLDDVDRRAAAGASSLLAQLAALPADQRAAVEAHVLDERGYAEIAEELQCSSSVVRKRVSRALQTLRHLEGGRADA